jgi:hypothetical protein
MILTSLPLVSVALLLADIAAVGAAVPPSQGNRHSPFPQEQHLDAYSLPPPMPYDKYDRQVNDVLSNRDYLDLVDGRQLVLTPQNFTHFLPRTIEARFSQDFVSQRKHYKALDAALRSGFCGAETRNLTGEALQQKEDRFLALIQQGNDRLYFSNVHPTIRKYVTSHYVPRAYHDEYMKYIYDESNAASRRDLHAGSSSSKDPKAKERQS